jgi:hypothetical protein
MRTAARSLMRRLFAALLGWLRAAGGTLSRGERLRRLVALGTTAAMLAPQAAWAGTPYVVHCCPPTKRPPAGSLSCRSKGTRSSA